MTLLPSLLWYLATGCFPPSHWFPDGGTFQHCSDLSQLLSSQCCWKLCGTCPLPLQGLLARRWLGCAGARPSPRMSHILQGQSARMGSGKVPSWTRWKMNVACKVLQATSPGGRLCTFSLESVRG